MRHKIYQIACDPGNTRGCKGTIEDTHTTFQKLEAKVRALGWVVRKVNGQVEHICPSCQEVDS